MHTVWQETAMALRAAAITNRDDVHLAAREIPGDGVEAACGARSSQLPLGHRSFTTDPHVATCGACLMWRNAVAYIGGGS